MIARAAWAWIILVAAGCGAVGNGADDDSIVVVDGKADEVGFSYGIFSNSDYDPEAPSPLLVAFHDVSQGLPEGFSGHFDYTLYDPEEGTTTLSSGVFQLLAQGERTSILLQGYQGEEVGRFDWSYADGTLQLGENALTRLHRSDRPETVRECEAFDVLDYALEESFTPWEYPSVYVETRSEGGYEVTLGSSSFETGEDTIEVTTNEAGDFEARVVTSYEEVYVVRIPSALPSRGTVLHGSDGEEPSPMASLVCYPPAAEPPAPPPASDVTRFTCTTRVAEESGQTATIRFGVVGLDQPESMEIYWPDGVETPIAVEPETSCAYTLVNGMADGYLAFRDGKLRIFSDQIGYEFGVLELYQNSGFELGYFRFEMMDPDHTSFYSPVDCTLE